MKRGIFTMKVQGSAITKSSSNSGHFDRKACKIRVFRSFFLLRDTKMTLGKWVRTFITSKWVRLKFLSEYGRIHSWNP